MVSTTLTHAPVDVFSRARRALRARVAGGERTRLIDVSRWQPDIDYTALIAGGIPGAVIKLTEGAEIIDSMAATHFRGIRAAGGVAMFYHFFRSNLDGAAQAQFCLNAAFEIAGYLPRVLIFADVETADSEDTATRRARLLDFLTTVDGARDGWAWAGVYSSPMLWARLIGDVPWVNDYLRWVAHYTAAALPTLPVGWTGWEFWQYGIWNDHAWVDPIPGQQPRIDADWYNGSEQGLRTLTLQFSDGDDMDDPTIPQLPQAVVTADVLNVRTRPSTADGAVIAKLAGGDQVRVVRIDQTTPGQKWLAVLTDDNRIGWAAMEYDGAEYMQWLEDGVQPPPAGNDLEARVNMLEQQIAALQGDVSGLSYITPTHRVNRRTGSMKIKGRGYQGGESFIDLADGTELEFVVSQADSKFVRVMIGGYPQIVIISDDNWTDYVEQI